MRTQRSNGHSFKLALAPVLLVLVAAVACNGSSSTSGSPSADASPSAGANPEITPGTGLSPGQAIGTLISANGLDGHELDISRQADCRPGEEMNTVVPGTPPAVSRVYLGQFCLTFTDVQPEKSATLTIDLPDTGEKWEVKMEFDTETSLWKVKAVDKTSG